MSDWSDEETNDPCYADCRNFYKVERWVRDGSRVELMLYAGNSLDKARRIFERKHRPRIRLTIRQRMRVLDEWPRHETSYEEATTDALPLLCALFCASPRRANRCHSWPRISLPDNSAATAGRTVQFANCENGPCPNYRNRAKSNYEMTTRKVNEVRQSLRITYGLTMFGL